MDAKTITKRTAAANYVLNRRAAYVLGTCFLLLGTIIGSIVFWHLSPQRRLNYLRESAADYLAQEKWPQAAIQLRNVLQIAPDDVDALYELGVVHLNLYQTAVAASGGDAAIKAAAALETCVACFQRATELEPEHWPAQRWLLEFDVRVGNWQSAVSRLNALNASGRRHPLATLAWELLPSPHAEAVEAGRKAIEAGKPEQAASTLEKLVEHKASDLDVVETLSLAYARLQQTDKWQSLVERAERTVGSSARLDLIRAECHLLGDSLDAAEHYAQRAARAAHVEVPAQFLLAEIHGKRAKTSSSPAEHWELASQTYQKILSRAPWDQTAANNLAWILGVRLNRFHEGLAVSGAALARASDPLPGLLDTHGWLLLETGETARSILFLERAAQAAPEDPVIRTHLATAYRKAGRMDESVARRLDAFTRAIGLPPRTDGLMSRRLYLPPRSSQPAVPWSEFRLILADKDIE